jgi:hypothetical protein
MPDFQKGPNWRQPFGRNNFLRSTQDVKTESFTFSKAAIPAEEIDGYAGQKVLQPGTVLAKITSGPEAGKVGVFQAGATDGRQTAANIVGLNNTFLPWQLMERDVEVAAVVECRAVQGWCFEYNSDGDRVALTNATATELVGKKHLSIMFA